MNTMTHENGIRQLTGDELDLVTGGQGVGQAAAGAALAWLFTHGVTSDQLLNKKKADF